MKNLTALALLLLYSCLSQARPQLEDIKYSSEGDQFEVVYRFSEPVDKGNFDVEYINSTLQLNIKNSDYKEGKSLSRIDKEDVKSLFTYQVDRDLLRSRIIYNSLIKASDLKGKVNLDFKGREVILNINGHEKEMSLLPKKEISLKSEDQTSPLKRIKFEPRDVEDMLSRPVKNEKVEVQNIEDVEEKALALIKENTDSFSKEKGAQNEDEEKLTSKGILKVSKNSKKNLNLREDQIPVFKKNAQKLKESSSEGLYLRVLYSIGIVLVFSIGIFFFVKNLSKNKKSQIDNTKIRLLTQFHLGPKKTLTMVNVAGETILLGVTDQNINLIKSISLIDDEYGVEYPKSFKNEVEREINKKMNDVFDRTYFSAASKKEKVGLKPDRETLKQTQKESISDDLNDEFSVNKITKLVQSKLKNMRQI